MLILGFETAVLRCQLSMLKVMFVWCQIRAYEMSIAHSCILLVHVCVCLCVCETESLCVTFVCTDMCAVFVHSHINKCNLKINFCIFMLNSSTERKRVIMILWVLQCAQCFFFTVTIVLQGWQAQHLKVTVCNPTMGFYTFIPVWVIRTHSEGHRGVWSQ